MELINAEKDKDFLEKAAASFRIEFQGKESGSSYSLQYDPEDMTLKGSFSYSEQYVAGHNFEIVLVFD